VTEYVYGVVAEAATPPSEPGIGGAPVRLIEGSGAAALVSSVSEDGLRMGRSEALAHARVLEAALSQGTVLPMRFGVVMEGADEVRRRLLSEHDQELRDQLERFAGKVEVNLRVLYDEAALMRQVVSEEREVGRLRESLKGRPDDATYFDRIRLGELVAQTVERIREADAQAILDRLEPASLAVSVTDPAHERVALTASFLLERGRIEAFDRILDQVAAEQAQRMRFKYTGPLPPHSFVELSGSV
jgi:hypothetical protein